MSYQESSPGGPGPLHVCVYICTYICICIYIHTYIHTIFPREPRSSTCVYICVHIHTYTCICVHIHTYIHAYRQTDRHTLYSLSLSRARALSLLHTHARTHTRTHTHTHTHTGIRCNHTRAAGQIRLPSLRGRRRVFGANRRNGAFWGYDGAVGRGAHRVGESRRRRQWCGWR